MTDPKLLLQNCRDGIRRHSLRVLQEAHGAADQFNRSNQSLRRQLNAVEQD